MRVINYMKIILFIIFLIFVTVTYLKWNYKKWYERCEENSKHPEFIHFNGKKHI